MGRATVVNSPTLSPHTILTAEGGRSPRSLQTNDEGSVRINFHEVLEKIVQIDFGEESLEAAVQRLWDQAIAAQQQRADAHVLDRRFGSPTTWPGYHMARASVLLRA
jgi:hypothetical protein